MSVRVREPRRADESEDDFNARHDDFMRQVEEDAQHLRDLRAKHTGKAPKQEKKRTV